MKRRLMVGMVALLVAGSSYAQTWIFGPTLPFGYSRFDGEYYPPTGRVYFLGGRMPGGTTEGRIWSYDPIAGTFTDEQVDMEFPGSEYNVGRLNNPSGPDSLALYVVSGRRGDGTYINALQVYYPISGLAMALTSDPWPGRIGSKVSLPGHGIAVSGNKLYVFGGINTSSPPPYNTDSTFVYDPARPAGSRWTAIPTALLSLARGDITPGVVDSKIYAIGGASFDGALLHPTNRVERFDPANPGAGWVRMADLPDTLMDSQAFGFDTGSPYGLGNHLIVAGNNGSLSCYDYNVAANTWTTFPPLNRGRRGHAGCFIPGTRNGNGVPGMWVFGGSGITPDSTSEDYQLMYNAMEEQGNGAPRACLGRGSTVPNPFVSFATVPGREEERFELYNASGRKVGTYRGDLIGHDLGPGVYFVRAKGGTGITARVVKVR